MAYEFKDMELDDEQKLDLAVPCAAVPDKKLLPEYPWGLRLSLEGPQLDKLNFAPDQAGGMVHGHFMAKITSISNDQREHGSTYRRVELQIQQLCLESEDEENKEADAPQAQTRGRSRLKYKS